MNFFWISVLLGAVAGYLAKRVRGEGPYGLPGDIALGVVGALVAGWIFPGIATLSVGSLVVAFVGAVVVLWGIRALAARGPMTSGAAAQVKSGIWALIGGATIAIIVGFAWGGWTTAGATQKMADEAVLATRAAICVAQFMKAPDHQVRLKELKDTSSYERAAYIEKGGWDRMPGEDRASYTVSRACADGLEVLAK